MCYTCGCKQPFADHGDPRNITEKDLMESTKTKAASGADISKAKRLLGYAPKYRIADGINIALEWYLKNVL